MATTPQFLGPDGVYRTRFIFSTEQSSRFFTGTIDRQTIDVQVSIQGAPFVSDPDLVLFEGEAFTIPNPEVFPEGLELVAGENVIEVRTQDVTGSVSAPALTIANLVQEGILGVLVEAPTRISLERLDGTVKITIQGIEDDRVQGYDFYASASPGGGLEGYSRLNPNPISLGEEINETEAIGTLTVDASINLDVEGNPSADPLIYNVEGSQQDSDGEILQTDFNEVLVIPEDVRQIRTEITINRINTISFFSFEHSRNARPTSSIPTISNGQFNIISEDQPLYYIVRAIYFDDETQAEIASPFSEEVQGAPLKVSARIGAFPLVTREQIVNDTTLAIYRTPTGRNVNLGVGSVTKDTFIDPFSSEAFRVRVIADFLHKAQSFATLLQIDDPNFTGASIPPDQSSEKQEIRQAFSLVQDSDAQELINQAFEKLASNYGVSRRAGRKAVGEATFFTNRIPTATVNIPIGTRISGGGVNFRTTQAAQITLENIASFFNPITRRYSVRIAIEAEDGGANGNVGANQIRTIVQGPPALSVVNENATFGGDDREGNRSLAVRAQGRLSSVDSGTLQGYRMRAIDVPGVFEVSVVTPGDDLMQRDYDSTTKEHKGGKVDVWVRGSRASDVTDVFAFSFEIAKDVIFEPFGNTTDLVFRAVDSRLSVSNPIIEMLDFDAYNFGLRNDSTGGNFNLTGVEVVAYDRIQLSSVQNQPAYTLTNVIRGDFRFRTGDRYTLPRQPVSVINRLTGTVAGIVSPTAYSLVERDAPMRQGRSTKAGDYLLVTDNQDSTVQIPNGTPVLVEGEEAVPIGETIEYLQSLGINPLTVAIFNFDRTVEYVSPFDPSGNADYTIVEGSSTEPLGFVRTVSSTITSGERVLVDYYHDENFEVNYRTDFLATALQNNLDGMRHVTADVLGKIAIPVPVDIEATIVLRRGRSPGDAEGIIRTNISNFLSGLRMNEGLYPSDITSIIDLVEPVRNLSLTKQVRSEGALVVREFVITSQDSDLTEIAAWSTSTAMVWLIEDSLNNATTDGGGASNRFRGVFQDDDELELQTVAPNALGGALGRAFIIGNDGLIIPGLTDSQTLIDQGFEQGQEVQAQRRNLTANRVLLSIGPTDSPTNYEYSVTYYVSADTGVKEILPGPTEYLILGNAIFTYDEARS